MTAHSRPPRSRHPRRHPAAALVGVLLLAMATAVPAHADESGTVTATVTVSGGPCLTVGASTLDFGSVPFSTSTGNVISAGRVDGTTDQLYQLESCSSDAQDLTAIGSDAASATSSWALVQGQPPSLLCDGGPNEFWLSVDVANPEQPGTFSGRFLRSDLQALIPFAHTDAGGALPAGETRFVRNVLTMPCNTSSGVGETFTMQVTYTAAVAP